MELRDNGVGVSTRLSARMIIPGFPEHFCCTATAISEQGATLKVFGVLGIPDKFELVIGTKRYDCKVIQKVDNNLRVSFNP
jgi:hypothetical protein